MKRLMVLISVLSALLPQPGRCDGPGSDPTSLRGIARISSVSVSILEVSAENGKNLFTRTQNGQFMRVTERQIKDRLAAAHIPVVEDLRPLPDAGHLTLSVVLISDGKNKNLSFVSSFRVGQPMTLVRTGASGYVDTYEGKALGSIPLDSQYLSKIISGLTRDFIKSYSEANPGTVVLAKK